MVNTEAGLGLRHWPNVNQSHWSPKIISDSIFLADLYEGKMNYEASIKTN